MIISACSVPIAAWDEIFAVLDTWGEKLGAAFVRLRRYLERFGSIPSTETDMMGVMNCSARFLRERAWPYLCEWLVLSDDGRRYSCPEIVTARRAPASPPSQRKPVSPRHQMAANMRHHGNPFGPVKVHASDATLHASDASGDAKTHAFSMPDASSFASSDASDASARAGASSLSPKDSLHSDSQENSQENRREPLGERANARDARAYASDANLHASDAKSDASADAKSDASADAKSAASAAAPRAKKRRFAGPINTTIPPDWQPTPEGELEARRRGYDPADLAENFRIHYLGNGAAKADWDQVFLAWCRREAQFNGRQGHLPPMGIKGGAVDMSEAQKAEKELASLVGQAIQLLKQAGRGSLMPPFEVVKAGGQVGIAWLQRILSWARGGCRGECPPEFGEFVRRAA